MDIARMLVVPLLVDLVSAGCASLPNSQDRVGEQVELRMLTIDDMNAYTERDESKAFLEWFGAGGADGEFAKGWTSLQEAQWIRKDGQSPILAAMAPVLIGLVVGAAIDATTAALDAQALQYEAQFGESRAFDGFWEPVDASGRWRPKYVGFEIVRYTRRFPKQRRPGGGEPAGGASRAIVLFVRSRGDERFFLLHPFFYANRSAKAKVDQQGGSITATIDLAIDAAWIAMDQSIQQQQRLAAAQLTMPAYPMTPGAKSVRISTDPSTDAAGWFMGVPVSVDKYNNRTGDGVFRIVATVTERDESKARETIERVSRFIGSQRQRIVDTAAGAVGGG